MLADSAEAVLALLGPEAVARGILERADLPQLIQALEAGVAADEARLQQARWRNDTSGRFMN